MSGIEHFTGLESLDCSGNNIEVLDLSSNAVLRRLNCSNNNLAELDLSEKLYLTDVNCSGNKITKLALSNACALRNLNCSNNAIEEIDLHDSRFLSELRCYNNPIKKLILDNCAELRLLSLNQNREGLTYRSIYFGSSITIIGYSQAASLDFSIRNTPFTSVVFHDSPGVTSLTLDGDFTRVSIYNNALLESFDFSGHKSFSFYYENNDALASLNLDGCTGLTDLNCYRNSALASLNLDGCTGLTDLSISYSDSLASLNLDGCTSLTNLFCSNNALLSTISLGNCTAIKSLGAVDCALSSIDVSNYPSLVRLNVAGNSLQKINVRNNPMLEYLNISGNALSSVNVRNNTALKTLNISGNRDISFIDLGNNPVLEELNVSGLSIDELDLTSINQLKKLDVTDNPDLTKVICPSQEWLYGVYALNDWSEIGPYEDSDGKHIYAGTVIDGLYWAWCNAGYTTNNLYGNTYDFPSAQKACPDGWRTPTIEELKSLSKNGSSKTTFNGMDGRWFSGSNSYSSSVPAIFLPYIKNQEGAYYYGWYWSSIGGIRPYLFSFYGTGVSFAQFSRSKCLYVRCVKDGHF